MQKASNGTVLVPLFDRVVVKRLDPESKTRGGILLPDNAKEKPKRGTILAVGPGRDGQEIPLKKGDLVLFTAYSGHEYKDDDYDVLVMNCDDVLAKVEKA